jgi:Tfp pilus assembly protein PilW
MKQKGFTLTELLVYMALVMFFMLAFGKQFKVMVNRYTYGKTEVKQLLASQDIVSTMTMDIRNAGFKTYYNSTLGAVEAANVTVSGTDKSSIVVENGTSNANDKLTVYKAVLDAAGALDHVESVKYYVDNTNTLIREYGTRGATQQTVSFAGNVVALQFEYGINLVNTSVLDENPFVPANWKKDGTTMTGAAVTFGATAATGNIAYNTAKSVTANNKYLVTVKITPSTVPANFLNYLRFSFKNGGTEIGSETFYPRSDTVKMVIPVSATASASISIDYSSKGSGTITIAGIEITCVDAGAYTWVSNPTDQQRLDARAVKMHLLTKADIGVKMTGTMQIADATVTLSGNYSYRRFTNIVEIPNNGASITLPAATYNLTLADNKIRPILLSVQY